MIKTSQTYVRGLVAAGLLASAAAAGAEAPEQIYERAPGPGHTRIEYNGQFLSSRGGHRPQILEVYHGVGERVALGVSVEGASSHGEFEIERFGAGALVDLIEDAPVEVGFLVEAAVTTDGEGPQLQGRLILESEFGHGRALGNVIVRRENTHEDEGTYLGYSGLLDFQVAEHLRLGIETSGQAARLEGFSHHHFDRAHYVGPSVTAEWELENHQEFEAGLKYVRRVDSDEEYRDTLRLVLAYHF